VNPPRYVVSVNEGPFTLIPTQPFVTAVLSLGGRIAVAADGSLLAASGQGANTCIIRRSNDGGTSWTTVYTDLVRQCSIGFGAPTPPGMYCAEDSGYCAVIDMLNVATIFVIYSTDYGQTWNTTSYGQISADSQTYGPALSSSGDIGIITRGANSVGGQPFGVKVGDLFVATFNFVPPVNLNCFPLIQGTSTKALCTRNGVAESTYRYVEGQSLPIVLKTLAVPDGISSVNPQSIGYNSSVGYLIQVSSGDPSRLNIYATTDEWSSVILLGQITPTTAPIGGCCRGNIIKWQGKIYFSSGAAGSNAFLAVIK
jgi:hypothetical protein